MFQPAIPTPAFPGVEPSSHPSAAAPASRPPLVLGSLRLASRFVLAPLAGYTNLAFRRVVRELGPLGLATTDLVSARGLLEMSRKSLELVQTCPEDRPLSVQLYGSQPDEVSRAAQWVVEHGASVVDLNMGCPVHKVVRNGGGSAMLCDPVRTIDLVRSVVNSVPVPVTVKMRLGWEGNDWSAPYFARQFEQIGVAAVIIHGRTRAQGFSGDVSLDGIRAVVEAVDRLPIIGNGDVRTSTDAFHMLSVTGCAGVAIGRGALLNPWIFTQLDALERTGVAPPPPTGTDRLHFMERHFHFLVELRGEHLACLSFRKVANWYCKVLRPGRHIQQQLIRLASIDHFDSLVDQMRQTIPNTPPSEVSEAELPVRVPAGPIEHW